MLQRSTYLILGLILGLYFLFSCQSGLSVETMQYATNGQKVYTANCQNCHGANGEGLGKLYPPLNDTMFLNLNRDKLACIVKDGMSGEITINGEKYNQAMPGVPQMNSTDIAYVLTYVTTYFGNSKTHFTREEIEKYLKDCD
ncbi:c-type cytochrome [Sphingobacterium sp. DK4209]|uniref:C-type cytochrome n=1 Tax=Sphingobacterium zhuxiongii TaxID=2662364 RepID=A0A5Q0QCC5_9SPHI|nr:MULTISPECIES: cytochrome c [unclassified Sphingobacterium]MVZ67491.1 c-type cytochrome [Sphingobacterium sp. DK4209]QGA27223.1 c-type cytochrome [Sphingobacterium sp. dk4302]